ncbi:uncharacterized protein LOC141526162 [Cotesia typhae]|uniref:uncharacterized protein LOC141526162 n=1 Tax=Cotesia typhae TaxID=2053667 RepID=UPI003D6990F5
MSNYWVVKFGKDEDPWVVIPELWLTQSDIGDDDHDDYDDYDQCWFPNNDSWYKSKNQIIFNGSTKGWQLYDIFRVDDFQYDSLEAGEARADILNRRDFEDKGIHRHFN